jgi:spermidine/putrescine transport system permease protein
LGRPALVSATGDIGLARPTTTGWVRRLGSLILRSEKLRGYLLLSPTLIVMLVLLIVPIGGLVVFSFWTQHYFDIDRTFTLNNYWTVFQPAGGVCLFWGWFPFPCLKTPIYVHLLGKSLLMSLITTSVIILLAYPMAYFLAFRVTRHKMLWIILITVPFWTSYLLRVFAWKVILGYNGVINSGLISLGLIDEPLGFILYNPSSVVITLTHAWLAFAILPIFVSLEKIDRSLLEAATDLGDGPVARFLRITLPLSLPGVIAASLLIFIPTVGDYVTPNLVGGTSGIMIGNVIQTLFGKANNWPLGAAVSLIMMLVVTLLVCAFLWSTGYRRMREREI